MLRRIVVVLSFAFACLLILGSLPPSVSAQTDRTPIPLATLVAPTPLPPLPIPSATPLPSQSAVARIKARISPNNKPLLIVGIPYNIPPFAEITDTGAIEGFEADIARAVGEDWGADIEWKQVTSENAEHLLLSGAIDFLIGEQIVSRNVQSEIDFTTPYFANRQVALALADATQVDIKDLNGQTVGVVSGSRGAEAFNTWAEGNGVQANVISFAMLDDALRALADQQITALVGDRWELDQRVGGGKVGGLKLLNGAFRVEPYAIAMVRYDASLRTLLERTLQRLVSSDRLNQIYTRWFPGSDLLPEDHLIPSVWRNLDTDQRTLNDFENDIVMPAQPVIDRIKNGLPLRVAGLGEPMNAAGTQSPLEGINRAMIEEMARRWGATVEYVPDSYGKGEDLLASGQADIAVGIEAKWGAVDRIDFAGTYAQRGYRMMVRAQSNVETFAALQTGSRNIGVFNDDPDAYEIAKKLAESIGVTEEVGLRRVGYDTEQGAADAVFNNNIRILFADAFRLIPLAAANPNRVQLTARLYDARPIAFGLPRNDVDFRVLIDVTLQEMVKDGTYQRLWTQVFNVGDPLSVVIWPGTSVMFGIKASS
ncbi:MAG: transporter substrate-binding domain-containing protein [Anaerolineae bacterium]|nr:transporter substrate-binding domain-containing protein [Anaerolineae bacterium]